MKTSNFWIGHFTQNALQQRINWNTASAITPAEIEIILPSLQAWQLGETSEGKQLIAAAEKYARNTKDPEYVDAIKLFIKEEQKHGNNLGRYLDLIGMPRIKKDWGDTLFRRVRHLNTSMEMWTLAVIVVESTAQIFYEALRDATGCDLLKQVCTDILIDEEHHITFQTERLSLIFSNLLPFKRAWRRLFYKLFFDATSTLVWLTHKTLFKAGGNTFNTYREKMRFKYANTIQFITEPAVKDKWNKTNLDYEY